ncbi:MAG: hypothetical protein FJ286_10755 [Planctomycetes bacterium]|nr:hypothetical protein [Planctomycetota bacterium]
MCHELSRCRQAGCTDTDTEVRRQAFLFDLAKATREPLHRFRSLVSVAANATAVVTTNTWRAST